MKQVNKEDLIERLVHALPILCARVYMTQDEVGEMSGLSC